MKTSMRSLTRFFSLLLALLTVLALFSACKDNKPVTPPSTDNGGDNTTPPDNSGDNTGDPAPEIVYLSNKELADELSSSVWKSDKLLGNDKKFGLLDPSAVGIDKEKFDTEVLYPIPDESEFAKIYNVTEYGVSADNADNAAAINALIETAAAEQGLKYIYFPAGTYKLASGLKINNVKDLYFGGEGVTLLGTMWFQMFGINNCENLHFNGITIDFDPAPSVAGEVVSYDATNVVIKVFDEFDMSNQLYPDNTTQMNMSLLEYKYDELTGRYVPNGYGNGCEDQVFGYRDGNIEIDGEANTVTIKNHGKLKKMEAGTVVNLRFTHNTFTCFFANNIVNAYWEGVSIHSNPGMAFYIYGNSENVYVNDLYIGFKEGSKQNLTTTSDGLHTAGVAGEIIVTNSTFMGNLDDCLNINTKYHSITSASGKTLTIADTGLIFEAGNVIEIFANENLSSLGTYTIESVSVDGGVCTLTLDKNIEGNVVGARLANVTRAPHLTLKNCLLGNKRNRGVLAQCRDSIIANNTFANFVHNPILIHSVGDEYGEAIVPKNITVENNKIIGSYHAGICIQTWGSVGTAAGVITDINIKNNFFANSEYGSVDVLGGGNIHIENNMFYNICRGFESIGYVAAKYVAVAVSTCENMYVSYNLLYTDEKMNKLSVVSKNEMVAEANANVYKSAE